MSVKAQIHFGTVEDSPGDQMDARPSIVVRLDGIYARRIAVAFEINAVNTMSTTLDGIQVCVHNPHTSEYWSFNQDHCGHAGLMQGPRSKSLSYVLSDRSFAALKGLGSIPHKPCPAPAEHFINFRVTHKFKERA